MSATDTALSAALRACRGQFLAAGLFGGAANLLQLTIPLHMMQVFDRVVAARSADTLLWGLPQNWVSEIGRGIFRPAFP